jgi:replication initiation and membrane attachment protein DnaB
MSEFSGMSPPDLARTQFVRHFGDFLKALSEVFPEDNTIMEKFLRFKVGIQMMTDNNERSKNEMTLLEQFHSQLSDHFDLLLKHDDFDVGKLSSEILKAVDPKDMQSFAMNMMSDEKAMANLCKIASGQIQKNPELAKMVPPTDVKGMVEKMDPEVVDELQAKLKENPNLDVPNLKGP